MKIKQKYYENLIFILSFLNCIKLFFYDNSISRNISIVVTLGTLIYLFIVSGLMKSREALIVSAIAMISLCVTMASHGGAGAACNFLTIMLASMVFSSYGISKTTLKSIFSMNSFVLLLFLMTLSKEAGDTYETLFGGKINSNMVGIFAMFALCFGVYGLTEMKPAEIKVLGISFISLACGYHIYLSGCRSALLGTLIFVGLLFVRKKAFSQETFRTFLLLSQIGSILFVDIYIILSRFSFVSEFTIFHKTLFSGRQTLWISVFKIFSKHPIFGSGGAIFLDDGQTTSAHNTIMSILYLFGSIPTICYLCFIGKKYDKGENSTQCKLNQFAALSMLIVSYLESFYMESYLGFLSLLFFIPEKSESTAEVKIMSGGYAIPKTIHYCWFGGKPLDKSGKKCIKSWKKFFPDFQIVEWNENNFDLNCCKYVREAAKEKKWAFVSDYARFKILYEQGGVYFDTDVEAIKSFDDILAKGAFMGCEISDSKSGCRVAPGLGMAAAPKLDLFKEILDDYEKSSFYNEDGSLNLYTVVDRMTNLLKKHGLRETSEIQKTADVTIYPVEYFCPINLNNGRLEITPNTRSIHKYAASWCDKKSRVRGKMYRFLNRTFGEKFADKIKKIFGGKV